MCTTCEPLFHDSHKSLTRIDSNFPQWYAVHHDPYGLCKKDDAIKWVVPIRVYRATLPFQWGVILWFQYADHSKIFPVSKFHIFHTQWPNVNNSQRSIYSNMAPRRSGQNCTFLKFLLSFNIPRRDLDTKKTPPHIEVCPESLGVMLEYWYIERGLS